MSLHQLAKHVQNQGRNGDTVLVHMTPSEVKGLQSLAMAAGGSLSINPNTGLPEANFLKSVLPVAIGAGLMAVGVPSPLMAAGITGLGYTAASGGNLQQGLMAGLGAYGGAGLTAGLMSSGAAALGAGSAPALGSLSAAPTSGTFGSLSTAPASKTFGALSSAAPSAATGASIAAAPTASASIQEGFRQAAANPSAFFKQNMFPIGATALGVMGMQPQQTLSGPSVSPGYIRPYTFSQTRNPRFGEPGQPYFTQSYTAQTPIPADQYGATMMADGGLATLPDARLALNATYPQSRPVDKTQYATPYQMPTSAENLAASYEMATSPYTGEPLRMAEGGSTKAAVDQYNKMLSERAALEYTRPEEFRQKYFPTPAPAPAPAPAQNFGGMGGGLMGGIGGLPTYSYNPQTMQYTRTGSMQPDYDYMGLDPMTLQQITDYQAQRAIANAGGGAAAGGMMPQDLGGYSDGGRLLKGPGDGVSDSIPATIGNKQPARLADGEFVVPARIVSELGNGSTDAGARKLYGMMDRIQKKRRKSAKGKSFAIDSKAEDALPA